MQQCEQSGLPGTMWNIGSYHQIPEMTRGATLTAYKELARAKKRHVVVMLPTQCMVPATSP